MQLLVTFLLGPVARVIRYVEGSWSPSPKDESFYKLWAINTIGNEGYLLAIA